MKKPNTEDTSSSKKNRNGKLKTYHLAATHTLPVNNEKANNSIEAKKNMFQNEHAHSFVFAAVQAD